MSVLEQIKEHGVKVNQIKSASCRLLLRFKDRFFFNQYFFKGLNTLVVGKNENEIDVWRVYYLFELYIYGFIDKWEDVNEKRLVTSISNSICNRSFNIGTESINYFIMSLRNGIYRVVGCNWFEFYLNKTRLLLSIK